MVSNDGLRVEDDILSLRAANSALQAQNIKLQRDYASLQEQLAALRSELSGVGRAVSQGSGVDGRKGQVFLTPEAAAAPNPAQGPTAPEQSPLASQPPPPRAPPRHGLSRAQAERYSRHLLLPAFGVAAQERLCRGSVLVVGCGGLGSPVAMYLAAAGVGRLGLVDHDTVDVTNLHRQVLHATSRVGMHKALSGRFTCGAINPTIQIDTHTCGFTPATALGLTDQYDVVVDASDNAATRYLVSDACVVSGKPLVSAAAVGTDGQLTVYNDGQDGPCYRCLFPESPAPENCSRCGEAGVLGVVPGVMGCLQALEAIKILSGVGDVSSKKLTLFDALAGRFTSVRLRSRNPACAACGTSPVITRASLPSYDYVLFTGQPPDDGPPEDLRLIDPRIRLEPRQVAELLAAQAAEVTTAGYGAGVGANATSSVASEEQQQQKEQPPPQHQRCQGEEERPAQEMGVEAGSVAGAQAGARARAGGGAGSQQTLFLDVRPTTQYDVMALPGVVHVPYERLEECLPELLPLLGGSTAALGAAVLDSAGQTGNAAAGGAAVCCSGVGAGRCEGKVDVSNSAAAATANEGAMGRLAPPRVVVLCRRGNNSQRVVARLTAMGVGGVTDMRGGYAAWAREVDPDMPLL